MTTAAKENIYSRITSQIIDQLERGVVPWVKPWRTTLPFNVVSGRPYRGINVLSTWAHQLAHSYQCNGYLTFKQAKDLGGWVRRGEQGAPIILYRPIDRDEKREEDLDRRLYVARGYSVTRDEITMPGRSAFSSAQNYYSTLLHELSHWSGAPGRLARDQSGGFGSATYAKEELVAELGAAFLAARLGIEHVSQAASYLQSWLAVLQNDNRFLFVAARQATEAAMFIHPDDSRDQTDQFVS